MSNKPKPGETRPPITPVCRITLPDGRWLDMHVPSVDQEIEIADLPDAKTRAASILRMRFWRDTFRIVTVATSWGGDVGDLSIPNIALVIREWMRGEAEEPTPAKGPRRAAVPEAA